MQSEWNILSSCDEEEALEKLKKSKRRGSQMGFGLGVAGSCITPILYKLLKMQVPTICQPQPQPQNLCPEFSYNSGLN